MDLAGGSARACLVLFMGSAPGPAPEGSADPAGPQPGGNQLPRREQAALLQRLRHVLAPSSQAPRLPEPPGCLPPVLKLPEGGAPRSQASLSLVAEPTGWRWVSEKEGGAGGGEGSAWSKPSSWQPEQDPFINIVGMTKPGKWGLAR